MLDPNQDNEKDGQGAISSSRSPHALRIAVSVFIEWLAQEAARVEGHGTSKTESTDNPHGYSGESEQ